MSPSAPSKMIFRVAKEFGPIYKQLKIDLLKEKNIHGGETSCPLSCKNHWLWVFVGKYTICMRFQNHADGQYHKMCWENLQETLRLIHGLHGTMRVEHINDVSYVTCVVLMRQCNIMHHPGNSFTLEIHSKRYYMIHGENAKRKIYYQE